MNWRDACEIAGGICLIGAGYLVWPPLALIAAALLLFVVANFTGSTEAEEGEEETTEEERKPPTRSRRSVVSNTSVSYFNFGDDEDERSILERIAPMSLQEHEPSPADRAIKALRERI